MFMRKALFYINSANDNGDHAIALSLLRQCSDPLFIVECGITKSASGQAALEYWVNTPDVKIGNVRKQYAEKIWGQRRGEILGMSWNMFFSDFYSAIQDYAHYNPKMLQWTFTVDALLNDSDSNMLFQTSLWKYNPENATRITLYQSVIVYALARSVCDYEFKTKSWNKDIEKLLDKYEEGLSESKLIRKPVIWKNELLGLTFDLPSTR
jgi:hypothetical protein